MENSQIRVQNGIKEVAPQAAILMGGAIASKIVSDLIKPANGKFTLNALLIILVAIIAASYSRSPQIRMFMFGVILWQVLKLLFIKTGFGDINKYFKVPFFRNSTLNPQQNQTKQLNRAVEVKQIYDAQHLLGLSCPGDLSCPCSKNNSGLSCDHENKVSKGLSCCKDCVCSKSKGLSCNCKGVLGLGTITNSQMKAIGASDDLLTLIPSQQWDAIYNSCGNTNLMTLLSNALVLARSDSRNVITGVTVNTTGCSAEVNYSTSTNTTSYNSTGSNNSTFSVSDGIRLRPEYCNNSNGGIYIAGSLANFINNISTTLKIDNNITSATFKVYKNNVLIDTFPISNGSISFSKQYATYNGEVYRYTIDYVQNGKNVHLESADFICKDNLAYPQDSGSNGTLSVQATTNTNPPAETITSPIADFSFSVQNCSRYVYFQNNSTGAQSYLWDFGDGAKATGASVGQHYYEPSKGNTFIVGLQAKDATGKTNYITKTITFPDSALVPVASFLANVVLNSVQLTNTSQYGSAYLWDFGDGTQATTKDATKTYNQPGTYTITLKVTNACGVSTTTTKTVTIEPVIAVGNPCDDLVKLGLSTQAAKFMSEASCRAVAGCPNVGKMIDAINCSMTNPNNPKSGMAEIVIANCDPANSSANKIYFNTGNGGQMAIGLVTPPTLDKIEKNGVFEVGNMITFTLRGSNMPTDSITWDFGDGVIGTGSTSTHIYTKGGNFTVRATVKGCKTVSISEVITVNEPVIITPPPPADLFLRNSFVLLGDQSACVTDPPVTDPPVAKKEVTYPPVPDPPVPYTPTYTQTEITGKDEGYSVVKFNNYKQFDPCLTLIYCSTDPCIRQRKLNQINRNYK